MLVVVVVVVLGVGVGVVAERRQQGDIREQMISQVIISPELGIHSFLSNYAISYRLRQFS